MTRPGELIAGGARSIARRGVRQTGSLVVEGVQRHVYLQDVHLWYVLETYAVRRDLALKPHLRIVQGAPIDADRLLDLPTISPERGRDRLAAGADLWLVLDDEDRTAFACWTFHGATPVLAAPGGMLELPHGVASLEDSVTSPDHRGQGIAPAAWTQVAAALAARGVPRLLTTVAADNAPSRKAVGKAGFVEYGAVRYTRRGPFRRTEVWTDGSDLGEDLRLHLRGIVPDEPPPVALPAR